MAKQAKQTKAKTKKKVNKKDDSSYASSEEPKPKKKPAAKKPNKRMQPPKKHKITKSSKQTQKGSNDGRGYKPCQGCDNRIPIHRRVCTYCGTTNIMKKAKYDLSEILRSKTAKALQAVLEQNDSNMVQTVVKNQSLTVKHKDIENTLKKNPESRVVLDGHQHTILLNTFVNLQNNINVFKAQHPVKNVKFNKDCTALAFTTQEIYECQSLTDNERVTLKAYGLERLEKAGHEYHGYSRIFVSWHPFQKIAMRMNVAKVIRQFMWLSDSEFIILCGQGSLHLYQMPTESTDEYWQSISSLEGHGVCKIEQLSPCGVPTIACGDNQGDIHIVEVKEKGFNVVRSILSAHGSYITAVRNCPINHNNCLMFATGAYDGYVKVWSLKDIHSVYEQEVSNRKVVDIQWDSGAKFLFVLIDDQNEGCVLLSFYSVSKNQSRLSLVSETQFRYVKELTNFTHSSISHTNQLLGLASQSGVMCIYPLETLRKLSVKKKKSKTNETTKEPIMLAIKGGALQINTKGVSTTVVEKQELVGPLVAGFDLGCKQTTAYMAASTYSNHVVIHQSAI